MILISVHCSKIIERVISYFRKEFTFLRKNVIISNKRKITVTKKVKRKILFWFYFQDSYYKFRKVIYLLISYRNLRINKEKITILTRGIQNLKPKQDHIFRKRIVSWNVYLLIHMQVCHLWLLFYCISKGSYNAFQTIILDKYFSNNCKRNPTKNICKYWWY